MSDIQARVFNVITEQLGVKVEEISLESRLVDDLGADSLDTVEFLMSLEEEFGVEVSDEEAENIATVADVVELVTKSEAA